MNGTVTIYGRSDDLVCAVGDVPGCNEYDSWDKPKFVEMSNGLAFRVEYTDAGVWKVTQVQTGGSATDGTTILRQPHGEGDDPEPYTETVTVTGPIEWVEVWNELPPSRDEMIEKIAEKLLRGGEFDSEQLTDGDVAELFSIACRASRRNK